MTLERWKTISARDQLGHIASEIARAELHKENHAMRNAMLERAIDFIDLSLDDPKWRANPLPLLVLKEELAKAYVGAKGMNLADLYAAI